MITKGAATMSIEYAHIILAIDPGEKGGAALFVRAALVGSWRVKPGGEHAVVAESVLRAEGEPLVVVMEKWTAHGAFGGSRTMGGLGRHAGRWEGALLAAGVPRSRVVRVLPQTWQARTIPYLVGQDRDERLRLVEQAAQRIKPGAVKDEAAAICIGLWATRAREVIAVMPLAWCRAHGLDGRAARTAVASAKKSKRAKKSRAAATRKGVRA